MANQRSTKVASKVRREAMVEELTSLSQLMPINASIKRRLSQLQLMSLVTAYITKSKKLSTLIGNEEDEDKSCTIVNRYGFEQALHGFILAATADGRLMYFSDNVIDYLGYSTLDLLTHNETIYDVIDPRDHCVMKNIFEQSSSASATEGDHVTVSCRFIVARNFRRHAGCHKYKELHMRGRMVPAKDLNNEPVFVATCYSNPKARNGCRLNASSAAIQCYDTMTFVSVHGLDMKYVSIEPMGEWHMGYGQKEIIGASWYEKIHPDDIEIARAKHRELVMLRVSNDVTYSVNLRVQTRYGHYIAVRMQLSLRSIAHRSPIRYVRCRGLSSAADEVVIHVTNHVIDETLSRNLFESGKVTAGNSTPLKSCLSPVQADSVTLRSTISSTTSALKRKATDETDAEDGKNSKVARLQVTGETETNDSAIVGNSSLEVKKQAPETDRVGRGNDVNLLVGFPSALKENSCNLKEVFPMLANMVLAPPTPELLFSVVQPSTATNSVAATAAVVDDSDTMALDSLDFVNDHNKECVTFSTTGISEAMSGTSSPINGRLPPELTLPVSLLTPSNSPNSADYTNVERQVFKSEMQNFFLTSEYEIVTPQLSPPSAADNVDMQTVPDSSTQHFDVSTNLWPEQISAMSGGNMLPDHVQQVRSLHTNQLEMDESLIEGLLTGCDEKSLAQMLEELSRDTDVSFQPTLPTQCGATVEVPSVSTPLRMLAGRCIDSIVTSSSDDASIKQGSGTACGGTIASKRLRDLLSLYRRVVSVALLEILKQQTTFQQQAPSHLNSRLNMMTSLIGQPRNWSEKTTVASGAPDSNDVMENPNSSLLDVLMLNGITSDLLSVLQTNSPAIAQQQPSSSQRLGLALQQEMLLPFDLAALLQ